MLNVTCTLNTALPFVLILLCYFTCKCYPSWVTFMIPESFLKISVRVKKKIFDIILITVDQILLTIKQLKQVTPCCINWLCLSLLSIKYTLSGHSAARGIKHLWKFISGFIGPQILNFERSLSLSPGPQSSHVPPCKISLGGSDGQFFNI